MLVVKVEIWPYGSEFAAKELGRVLIANDGTGDMVTGKYDVDFLNGHGKLMKEKRIESFARSSGFWELLKRVFS